MKATLFILVFLTVLSVVFSAVFRYPKIEGKPGDCWSEDTGPMISGETKQLDGKCSRANCSQDGTIQVASCGVARGPNGATDTDYSKTYPECCPRPK